MTISYSKHFTYSITMTSTLGEPSSLYIYNPSHVLPAVFAALTGLSLLWHIYQNMLVTTTHLHIFNTKLGSKYRFWRITFFISWGGAIFTTGWILRCISTYHPTNKNLYIAQTIFIYVGPPVYAGTAYNLVGRLMNYLPEHAVLHPNRVLILFVYIGALVESVSAAGAAKSASAGLDLSEVKSGGTLIAAGLVLQAAVEACVILIVSILYYRCKRTKMLSSNVRILCITLYGTSTLVLLRCIFRAVEAFDMFATLGCQVRDDCGPILSGEWYLYAFELGPMFVFTWWLNLLHPGRQLPREKNRYLDLDGKTERIGPGWIDRRSRWKTFVDPLDLGGLLRGEPSHEKYWFRAEDWPVCEDSFAVGTASNTRGQGA